MKKILILILTAFIFMACSSSEETPPPAGTGGIDNGTDNPGIDTDGDGKADNVSIAENGYYVVYTVSQSEFDTWNTTSSGDEWNSLMKKASTDVLTVLRDEFDFIFFAVDNEETPGTAMATGSQIQVSSDIMGLGYPPFDKSADYGSAGNLKSVITIWQDNLHLGPLIHEMGHYWFNHSITTYTGNGFSPHWSNRMGIDSTGAIGDSGIGAFSSPGATFADVELYLMGLLPSNEIQDSTADDAQVIIGKEGERSPAFGAAPTSWRGLVVVISTENADTILDETKGELTRSITTIESTNAVPEASGINFYRQTKNKGHLYLSGVDQFKL